MRRRLIEEIQLRNLSPNTERAYVRAVRQLAEYHGRAPDRLSSPEIRQFLLSLVRERKIAWGSYNQILCALRFFYKAVLGRDELIDGFRYPRDPKRLPVVLGRGEVRRLLDAARLTRHRAFLSTLYAAGLRVGELVRLRPQDVDGQRKVIHVRQGKNLKDRYVMLSDGLLEQLRAYWKLHRSADWLFPNRFGRPIGPR